MKGSLRTLSLAALLLNICLSTFALPIVNKDDGEVSDDGQVDPILLLATGLLNQEKRLQAMEQRLKEMSSTSVQTAVAPSTTSTRARLQQSLEERQLLPLDTRMTYVEEDVVDNLKFTDNKLQTVHDLALEAVRRESEDIRVIHQDLSDNVARLEREINATFARTEGEIGLVKAQADENRAEIGFIWQWYFVLNDGLFATIDYARSIEYTLEDRIYVLEEQMKEVLKYLQRTQAPTQSSAEPSTEPSTEPPAPSTESTLSTNGIPTEPNVGGVGETGGGKAAQIMSDAKKALQDWIDLPKPTREPTGDNGRAAQIMNNAKKALEDWMDSTTQTAGVQENANAESTKVDSKTGKSQSATLQELLYELNNYNM